MFELSERTSYRSSKAWVQSGLKGEVGKLGWTPCSKERGGGAIPFPQLFSQAKGLPFPPWMWLPKKHFLICCSFFSTPSVHFPPSYPTPRNSSSLWGLPLSLKRQRSGCALEIRRPECWGQLWPTLASHHFFTVRSKYIFSPFCRWRNWDPDL